MFVAPQLATIATWVPSGAKAAYSTPSPDFLPCILSVISPCQTQSTGLDENGFAVVYSPISVWFGSVGSVATTRIARPSGDQVGRSTLKLGSLMHEPWRSVEAARTKQRSPSVPPDAVGVRRTNAITLPSGENAGRRSSGPAVI